MIFTLRTHAWRRRGSICRPFPSQMTSGRFRGSVCVCVYFDDGETQTAVSLVFPMHVMIRLGLEL